MMQSPLPAENTTALLDCLESLLDIQKTLIQKNDYRKMEPLLQQTSTIIAEIANSPIAQENQLKSRCEKILKSYQQLVLMVGANREAIRKNMRHIGCGRKMLRAYGAKSK